MNRTVELTPRLMAVSNMVRKGVRVADIGTDHAFLPIYLVDNNIASFVTASDVNDGPLKNAAANVAEYGYEDRIKLCKACGLDGISENDADDITIAGMGGELICKIIGEAPFLKNPCKHLILQPMTRANELRKFLCDNGFEIVRECAVSEGRRVYTVMLAVYYGEPLEYNDVFLYTGKLNPENDNDAILYIKNQAEILKKAADGMSKSEEFKCKADELYELSSAVLRKIM